ncbi:protein of unknown function [Streptomyces murinus]
MFSPAFAPPRLSATTAVGAVAFPAPGTRPEGMASPQVRDAKGVRCPSGGAPEITGNGNSP